MDWTLFYLLGAIVTVAVMVFTIYRMDLSPQERLELGFVMTCGLWVWPVLLYGLIALNQMIERDPA